MSMTLSVVEFKNEHGQLQADYESLSKDVVVTEYLNSIISEEYMSELSVFENGEEVFYREINLASIKQLSPILDEYEDSLFIELIKTSGKNKRSEIIDNLRDLSCLNRLVKKILLILLVDNHSNVRLIIA